MEIKYSVEEKNKTSDELIREYREKNDALNGVISEYKEYKYKNKELAASIDEIKDEMELIKKQVEEKEHNEEKLKAEVERISSQNEIAIQKAQMEKERALLELRERHQTKNEELGNDYNAKVDEYDKKIKALLDEIEIIRGGNALPSQGS